MSTATAFSANRDEILPQGVSGIAPANETNMGLVAAAAKPATDGAVAERAGTTSESLASFAQIEGARMNQGDVGFFGSQVAKTIGEATGALFSFASDKSEPEPVSEEPEVQVAAPQMPQFTAASPGFGSGPG